MYYGYNVFIADEGNVVLQFFNRDKIQDFAISLPPESAKALGELLEDKARSAEKKKKEKERQELLEAYEQGKMAAEEALSKLLDLH